jgi:hypothetical protein
VIGEVIRINAPHDQGAARAVNFYIVVMVVLGKHLDCSDADGERGGENQEAEQTPSLSSEGHCSSGRRKGLCHRSMFQLSIYVCFGKPLETRLLPRLTLKAFGPVEFFQLHPEEELRHHFLAR